MSDDPDVGTAHNVENAGTVVHAGHVDHSDVTLARLPPTPAESRVASWRTARDVLFLFVVLISLLLAAYFALTSHSEADAVRRESRMQLAHAQDVTNCLNLYNGLVTIANAHVAVANAKLFLQASEQTSTDPVVRRAELAPVLAELDAGRAELDSAANQRSAYGTAGFPLPCPLSSPP